MGVTRIGDGTARPLGAAQVDEPAASGSRRFGGLDGLRGLAVVAVVLYHAGVPWMPGGFLGVSVFFTLSGFLITRLLLLEHGRSGTIDRRRFWSRRFRRLLPASLAGVVLATAFTTLAGSPVQQATFRGDALAALGDVANWWFIHTGSSYGALTAAPSAVQHYWSLAIEEQFYLVFPLLVGLALARRGGQAVLAVVLAVLVVASTAWAAFGDLDPTAAYYATSTRVAELLLGALAAVAVAAVGGLGGVELGSRGSVVVAAVGAAALAACAASFFVVERTDEWVTSGWLTPYAAISALIVLAAMAPRGPVPALLGLRPLQALGRISYGVYLFHWPLLLWALPGGVAADGVARFALVVVATIGLASASFALVEVPIRRRQGFAAGSLRVAGPFAVAVVAGLVLLASPVRPPSAGTQLATAQPGELVVDRGTMPVGPPPAIERVRETPAVAGGATDPPELPDEPLRVLVLGDSTAIALHAALQRWGEETGIWGATGYGRGGCAIARGGQLLHRGTVWTVPPHCEQWAEDWQVFMAETAPDLIVVASGATDLDDHLLAGDDTWRSLGDPIYEHFLAHELDEAADVLTARGVPVVWLTVGPLLDGVALHPPQTDWPGNAPERADRYNGLLRETAAGRPLVRVVDLAAFYEAWPGGPFDLALRDDGLHLNEDSAAQDPVMAWLGLELLRAYCDITEATDG